MALPAKTKDTRPDSVGGLVRMVMNSFKWCVISRQRAELSIGFSLRLAMGLEWVLELGLICLLRLIKALWLERNWNCALSSKNCQAICGQNEALMALLSVQLYMSVYSIYIYIEGCSFNAGLGQGLSLGRTEQTNWDQINCTTIS